MKKEGEQSSWKWPTLKMVSFNEFHKGHQNPGELAHWEVNRKGLLLLPLPLLQQPTVEEAVTWADGDGAPVLPGLQAQQDQGPRYSCLGFHF